MIQILALAMCLQNQEPPPETPKLQPVEKKVVVIGQRREGDILDVPSAVTVIGADQIEKSGAANIAEVVQKQAGFFSAGAVKGAQDQIIDLRGFNNGGGNGQRTLVLVDGRKTNSVVGTATDWAAIPLDNIERIEIVRGPAAALYGDGALAGVINIVTKKGGKGTTSTVGASAGNWGTYKGMMNVSGSSDDVIFDVYAGVEGTDGWRDHSRYTGHNFTARLEAPVNASLVAFLKAGRHADTRERPGSLTKTDVAAFGREASVIDGSPSEFEGVETYIDAGLTQSLGDLGEASLFLNHTKGQGDAVFFDPFGAYVIDDASDITMLQLKHVVRPEILSMQTAFTTGVDLSYETADAESVYINAFPPPPFFGPDKSDYRRRLVGVYEHLEVRPADILVLTGSVRYDRALLNLDSDPAAGAGFDRQRAFDQLSPHAGVTLKLMDELSVYGSWGRTFKYPTRDELIGFTTFAPNLDPERSNVYETGVRVQSARWGSAGISAYRMEVKDEIFFYPPPPPPPSLFGTNLNLDEVVHQGIETEGRLTPWDWLELFATHAYVRAIITESDDPSQEGKQYPVTPRLSGTAGTTVRYEGAALTVLGRYAGDRMLVSDLDNSHGTLDSYWVLDARLAFTLQQVTAFLAVYNFTDREYYDNGGVSYSPGGDRFNPGSERSWMLGGDFRF